MRKYVNVYAVGRAYGGPAEGGWWYDTGDPVAAIPVELTQGEWETAREAFPGQKDERGYALYSQEWIDYLEGVLMDAARKLQEEWRKRYPYTRKRGEVLGGDDWDVVIEDQWPEHYPKKRPHYE